MGQWKTVDNRTSTSTRSRYIIPNCFLGLCHKRGNNRHHTNLVGLFFLHTEPKKTSASKISVLSIVAHPFNPLCKYICKEWVSNLEKAYRSVCGHDLGAVELILIGCEMPLVRLIDGVKNVHILQYIHGHRIRGCTSIIYTTGILQKHSYFEGLECIRIRNLPNSRPWCGKRSQAMFVNPTNYLYLHVSFIAHKKTVLNILPTCTTQYTEKAFIGILVQRTYTECL